MCLENCELVVRPSVSRKISLSLQGWWRAEKKIREGGILYTKMFVRMSSKSCDREWK